MCCLNVCVKLEQPHVCDVAKSVISSTCMHVEHVHFSQHLMHIFHSSINSRVMDIYIDQHEYTCRFMWLKMVITDGDRA